MSFFFSFLSFSFKMREREREREYTKLGIRRNSPKGTYLISLMEFRGESFFFYGLIDFIFNTGLKKMASSIRNIFMSSSTRSTGFGSVCHEPCPTTNFFFLFFRWRKEGATSVLGSKPITWLLSSSPWSGDLLGLLDVTQVRLLRTDSLT